MTKRESYVEIMAILEEVGTEKALELHEFIEGELSKMDEALAKRREQTSKKRLENQPLLEAIMADILTDEGHRAADVAAQLEISVQKASALLRQLVADGLAVQSEAKFPKVGTQKVYTKA